jgi:2-dehydro-3-deoxyphosphogluconate aldolase/(4S)-4-hydroxy-2-oxoglutarate aldolase
MKMVPQNGIKTLLATHQIIPVVTIQHESEITGVLDKLKAHGINIIEVTLRTPYALIAIEYLKNNAPDLVVGAGTVIHTNQIEALKALHVDFIVSPGGSERLFDHFEQSGIPFLPGASTPSEIIRCTERGYDLLKFFPADLFGGINALKTYSQVFSGINFCPTGGITKETYRDYLELPNVQSVGGSWMMK